jgi:hypothetical protein
MERKMIEIDRIPEAGKRLFDVENPAVYLNVEMQDLEQRVFCDSCAKDYRLGERKVEAKSGTSCPTTQDGIECDGSLEGLTSVRDEKHLMLLRRKATPGYPF